MSCGKLNSVMRFMKLVGLCVAVVVTVLAAAAAWVLMPVLSDPTPGFAERKGRLVEARETAHYDLEDSGLTEATLTSSSGLQVQLALRRPHRPLPGNPVMVLIAGQETGRGAAMLFPETHGVTVAALSYLYEGDPKTIGWIYLAISAEQ